MKTKDTDNELNEPSFNYQREFHVFDSFEEQAAFERRQMQELSPVERLRQLRQFINIAYGMHGYDPNNLPTIHTVRIIE